MDTDPSTPRPDGRPVHPVDLRDHVRFSEDHATRVRVFATSELAYDLWCIEPRQSTPVLHYPDQDTTYTVIGGRSWFVTDQGEIGLDPLGAILVPADVVHGIDNRGADPLIVCATSAPPSEEREDAAPANLRQAIHLPNEERSFFRRLADALIGGEQSSGEEPRTGGSDEAARASEGDAAAEDR